MKPIYDRVLLKISGEALAGQQRFGINEAMTRKVAQEVMQINDLGVQEAIVIGSKNVDAGYDKDPALYPDAKKFSRLTHMEVVEKDLKVMDLTAATLCKDNNIKIHVFAIAEEGNVMKAVLGEDIGTIIE